MREEPIISGAVLKAALVLLVAGGLGAGAYALAGGDIDVDLPDLPEIDTTTEPATTLEDTTIQDTTVGEEPKEPVPDQPVAEGGPFTTASLGSALATVRDEAGADAELTRVTINDVQTQLIVRRGDGIEAFSVRADSGEVNREEATITISGNATIADFAFPLAEVDPAAIDRMLASARKLTGVQDLTPTVLTLERRIPFGSRELEWAINAQGDGRYLTLRANPAGRQVRNIGGEGVAVPPAAQEAQKLNQCIQEAGNDPDEIFACLERF
jgi:hypothetical protein